MQLPASEWGSSHYQQFLYNLSEDWFLLQRANLSTRDDFGELALGFVDPTLGYRMTQSHHQCSCVFLLSRLQITDSTLSITEWAFV
jgi:hypothetical protein